MLLFACKPEYSSEEEEMFIKPLVKTYLIALPLQGKLMEDGKPLAKAKLRRELEWNGDNEGTLSELFYTDENGVFVLPAFEITTTMRGLEQFVGKTKVFYSSNNSEEILIWYNPTMSENLQDKIGEPFDSLQCDLSHKEVATQGRAVDILTICRWDGMPEFVEME